MSENAPTSWITEIRRRLANPPSRRLPPSDSRQAAVLVPLYVDTGELWTLLTRRSEELPTHKGQIAFPGGKVEEGEELWQAALRESEEEIGLDGKRVLELGHLDEADTPSGFRIMPCVGVVPFPLVTEPNGEIDEIFPVPISAFANPRMIEDRVVTIDGVSRQLRIFHIGGRQVWGLTARIIQNLLERLGMAPVVEE